MPSTYSPSLRLELIGNGEQAGSWGTTTNKNLGTLLEQAITGVQTIVLLSNTKTLTTSTTTTDDARNIVLNATGTLTAIGTVYAPLVKKTYIITNNTTGSTLYGITIGAAVSGVPSGTTVTIPNGATSVVYCDGTNFKLGLGSIPITNAPMNGFKHTGVAAATTSGEYAEYEQMNTAIIAAQTNYTPSLQMQTATAYTTGGTSSAFTVSPAAIAGFTGSIAATTGVLTVTVIGYGTVRIGMAIVGSGIASGARVTGFIGGSGGTGTYNTNQTAATTSTAIVGYAGLILNQRFRLKFNVTGTTTSTLSVSGTTATAIKQYDSLGAKTNPVIIANQLADVEYDGTHFVILNPLLPSLTSITLTTPTLISPTLSGTPTGVGVLTGGTAVVISGTPTQVTFTSIPTWVKKITVTLMGINTTSTGVPCIKIGSGGAISSLDYTCANSFIIAGNSNSAAGVTTAFELCYSGNAGYVYTGTIVLTQTTGNTWSLCSELSTPTTFQFSTGYKSLAAVLDQLQLTTVGGTDTFSAGTLNIMYE